MGEFPKIDARISLGEYIKAHTASKKSSGKISSNGGGDCERCAPRCFWPSLTFSKDEHLSMKLEVHQKLYIKKGFGANSAK